MRAAILGAILGVASTATAGPFYDVVKAPAEHSSGTKALTHVSHVIYMNPCLPDGCTVTPGHDDARVDKSSIPEQLAHLAAYPHGAEAWGQLVQCMQDMYAPFDVQVTDVDPGNENHFEVMIAGSATDVGVPGAGGVAPYIACDGQLRDNGLSFVFAGDISDPDFLCWAAAQETSHIFGLDHELDSKDPMTYLSPPTKKPGFQNSNAKCGESWSDPRECWCGGTTQNSYQYLMDTFGPRTLEPATLEITSPPAGVWVKPGFKIRTHAMSQLSVTGTQLLVDGAPATSTPGESSLVLVTPHAMAGGAHELTVVATDAADRTFEASINVNVTAACPSGGGCAGGFHCLGGYCLPGAAIAGGLGATCGDNNECITNVCGEDGSYHRCTQACDPDETCPSGYECAPANVGGGVCWPTGGTGGGCTSSGDASPVFALLGLALLTRVAAGRRRCLQAQHGR